MPGALFALRSSSSSSSSSSTAAPPCKPPAGVHPQGRRHRQDDAVPSPPPPLTVNAATRAPLPAFHTSISNMQVPACAQPIRPAACKQVNNPFSETVRTRLCGTPTLNYSSSGSPHDPSTVCLAAMVHEFLEEEVASSTAGSCGRSRCNCVDGVCTGDEDICNTAEEPKKTELPDIQRCEILEGIINCTNKSELLLLVDVARAVEAETEELMGPSRAVHATPQDDKMVNMELLLRPVMKHLRQEGYNAAICKSRWKHSDGLPAGDYDYVDVVMEAGRSDGGPRKKQLHEQSERFIIDIDFRSQFEIARAPQRYVKLLEVLPRLFVGKAEKLKQILKVMAAAAKNSLKEEGLFLPPWRNYRYMQAKWLSPYRRRTNIGIKSVVGSTRTSTTTFEHRHDEVQQLGVGFRPPKMMSVELMKEMDLVDNVEFREAAAKANAYACRLSEVREKQDLHMKTRVDVLLDHEKETNKETNLGFCTSDWKLPALEEKPHKATHQNIILVSGLSTALKQAAAFPKP